MNLFFVDALLHIWLDIIALLYKMSQFEHT